MKLTLAFSVLFLSLLLSSCSSLQSNITRLSADMSNNSASVTCLSAGELLFRGKTVGKPISETSSDGYYFKDAKTGKFIEISGDCIFTYD